MERSVFAATRFICTYFQRARFPEELVDRVAVNFANALLDGLVVGSNLELRLEINCNGTIALVLVDAAQPFNASLQELSDALPSEVVLCVHNDFARLLTAAGETLLYRAKDQFRRLYYDSPCDKPRIRFDAITGRFEEDFAPGSLNANESASTHSNNRQVPTTSDAAQLYESAAEKFPHFWPVWATTNVSRKSPGSCEDRRRRVLSPLLVHRTHPSPRHVSMNASPDHDAPWQYFNLSTSDEPQRKRKSSERSHRTVDSFSPIARPTTNRRHRSSHPPAPEMRNVAPECEADVLRSFGLLGGS